MERIRSYDYPSEYTLSIAAKIMNKELTAKEMIPGALHWDVVLVELSNPGVLP